jgi:hypothetical protein
MSYPRSLIFLFTIGFCLCAYAQKSADPIIDDHFVQKQFGENCSLVGMPSLKADMDGDGVEDIVIPARCTNPMMDQAENKYLVIDPYNSFFGYGNPKVTTQYASDDPARRGFSLLVIHGAGADAWHSLDPKAKFMIVNLPFKQIYIKKLAVRKKVHMAIYVEETGGDALMSAIYWDGRRYKYQPMGSSME